MPPIRSANLRYCTSAELITTATSIGWFDMRANSIFDPEHATGGGQPMGFDQWTGLFDQYIVTGAKCTVNISYKDQTDNKTKPIVCGVYLSDDATIPYTDWKGLVEAKKGSYRTLVPQQSLPVRVFSKFSCRKFFNVKDPLDVVGKLGAATNANPSEEAIFIIWADQIVRDASETQSVNLIAQITMDYHVQFTEPRDLVRS